MGRLMSVAYFGQTENCSDDPESPMPCCEDIEDYLKVQEFASTDFDFDSTPALFLISQFEFIALVNENSPQLATSFSDLSPPPLSNPSKVVLFENFRI